MAGRKKARLDASDLELFQITDMLPTVYQAALHLRVLTTRYKNRLVTTFINFKYNVFKNLFGKLDIHILCTHILFQAVT